MIPLLVLVAASHPRPPPHRRNPLAPRALPSGWSTFAAGGNDGGSCYIDSSTRLLPAWTYVDGGMTVTKCLTACERKGVPFAGIEYGSECYVSPFSTSADDSAVPPPRPLQPMPRPPTARPHALGPPSGAVVSGG